ncbi:MAG: metallophosphoesterase family protein, partial [Candidatus Heimdallarchaeaceae archaeon]
SYPFTFVHISDPHFPAYTESEDINTTAINLQKIEEIRKQKPDFAICTGDIIQGPTLVFKNPTTGKSLAAEVQLKLALWALDKLDVPVFIIAGNHDYEQSSLLPDNPKEVWKKYMGGPFVNFSYLDWSFVGFGSSFDGLSESEMQELNGILSSYDYTPITLFYHYNFRSQATSVINKHTVVIALYGHIHQEKLYMKNGTLYHCQDTLFHKEYSTFYILNSTSAKFMAKIYNFGQILISPTFTSKTALEPWIFAVSLTIVPLYNRFKKKQIVKAAYCCMR